MMFKDMTFERAEQVTKLAAFGVLIVYALGFLVSALYYSTLGIAHLNPLRPRILGAGMLFIVASAIAYFAGSSSFEFPNGLESFATADKLAYVTLCFGLEIVICELLGSTLLQMTDYPYSSIFRLARGEFISMIPLFLGLAVWRNTSLTNRVRSMAAVIGGIVPIFTFGYLCIRSWHRLDSLGLVGWLIAAGTLFQGTNFILKTNELSGAVNISSVVSQILIYLTLFTHSIYPHFRPEWGGGAPVLVTITFGKDAMYMSGRITSALLLDESDTGFYVVDKNLGHSYFVPRASVALIDYQPHEERR